MSTDKAVESTLSAKASDSTFHRQETIVGATFIPPRLKTATGLQDEKSFKNVEPGLLHFSKDSEVDVSKESEADLEPAFFHPQDFKTLINLASERVGSEVLYANNESFAAASNLLKDGRGVFKPGKYTVDGKWMDGWETARHGSLRRGGRDFCLLKLGLPGSVVGVDIDTNHFVGNYASEAMLEGCFRADAPSWHMLLRPETEWTVIVPKSPLAPGTPQEGHNYFVIDEALQSRRFTHLRFTIFPDGGVARLKVYGHVMPKFEEFTHIPPSSLNLINLIGIENGAACVACSDMFFSSPLNMLMPSHPLNMSDGWETKRSRGEGHFEWTVIRMCTAGKLSFLELDTTWFKHNFPYSVCVDGTIFTNRDAKANKEITVENQTWTSIVDNYQLKGHTKHLFEEDMLQKKGPFTHLRLRIFPDGGVARFKAFGTPVMSLPSQSPRV